MKLNELEAGRSLSNVSANFEVGDCILLKIKQVLLDSCSSKRMQAEVKIALKEKYKMTNLGELSWCLGIQVNCIH
jgi:hypothetical protein